MADYDFKDFGDFSYSVAQNPKKRPKQPPLIVVMNDSCTCCSGSPACMPECPVDCIHIMYKDGRPNRVYVENDVCIGCLNCFSNTVRPKHVNKGDVEENIAAYNAMSLSKKDGVCPWDAIIVRKFEEGDAESEEFYVQPRRLVESEPTE
jgi:ferredoxin